MITLLVLNLCVCYKQEHDLEDVLGRAVERLGIVHAMSDENDANRQSILLTIPGWGPVHGSIGKDRNGPGFGLRAFPQMNNTWPSTGVVDDDSESWRRLVDTLELRWSGDLVVSPEVLLLAPDEETGYATGEVQLSLWNTGMAPVPVNTLLGCGFEFLQESPLLVGIEPVSCNVRFDLHYPLSPEHFFLLLTTANDIPMAVPIGWRSPRPRLCEIKPTQLELLPGESARSIVVGLGTKCSVIPPPPATGLCTTITQQTDSEIEIVVALTSADGYGALPLTVIGEKRSEEHRLFIVPPWPLSTRTGQPIIGIDAIPGERILITTVDGLTRAILPDRFPGVETYLEHCDALVEQFVPMLDGETLCIENDDYVIYVSIDATKAAYLTNWGAMWGEL